jgi:Fe-S cluster assembly protein SufD
MKHEVGQITEWYRSRFERFERSLNGEAGAELHALRRRALDAFVAKGFPTTREEEWRFTSVAPIAKTAFVPAPDGTAARIARSEIERHFFADFPCMRLVFVNGHFSAELSSILPTPDGVVVSDLRSAIRAKHPAVQAHLARYVRHDENAFTALSTAFMLDGAFVFLPDSCELEVPIHLVFVANPGLEPLAIHPRNLIVTGRGSRVSIVETYVGAASGAYLTNAVTEFVVGEEARVEHDKLQDESLNGYHVGTVYFAQAGGSNVVSNAINFGGALVRNNITAVLNAERIETTLNGLSLATGSQLVDNHTTIDHAKPNCASHELYKAILDGKARGVFNGKIYVRKDAQKTDAKQTNKTLLLSDDATIDTKPQLEIFADDVKCTHGATVGHLDEEQMFYLRSRGIEHEHATDILTFAFASDIMNRIHVEPLRNQLDAMLHDRLRRGRTFEV